MRNGICVLWGIGSDFLVFGMVAGDLWGMHTKYGIFQLNNGK